MWKAGTAETMDRAPVTPPPASKGVFRCSEKNILRQCLPLSLARKVTSTHFPKFAALSFQSDLVSGKDCRHNVETKTSGHQSLE